MNARLQQVQGDVYDLVLYFEKFDTEFAQELIGWRKKVPGTMRIRMVKFVVAGVLAFTIPFSQIVAKGPRYAMSYLYFGSLSDQIEYISLAQETLAVVSPSYFDITETGALQINTIHSEFVQTMHQKDIKVVPFLSNHWDRQAGVAALERAEDLAQEIAQAVERYQLDGVNVDIENVTQDQREQYTKLVQLLRQKIPAEKEVSVAVAANPSGWTTGWQGSYDYRALGEAADHLFIMSYDEHYQGGPSGPVASLDFVEQSIQYALQYVPAEKIVLGIPFFGRIWAADGSVTGYGVSNSRVETWMRQYEYTKTYDRTARSPKIELVIHSWDTKPVVGGKELAAGTYTIWYEDSDSLKEKLALVDKYQLKGAGNWSAGQETRDVWEYYDLWLNGKYFSDIYQHFAKDDIVYSAKQGIMKGVTNTLFEPEGTLTRAQAAAVAVRMLPQLGAGQRATRIFSDVGGHWAEAEIEQAVAAGLLEGYPDGTFRPEVQMSREEMAVLLARMIQLDYSNTQKPAFSDVAEERWSYEEITALAGAGILLGYEDSSFRPERGLTRGEMAALVHRVIEQQTETEP